ncbi:MAG: glycosyltransferase WbuB, partial [Steroidobacteraceae bacterium]
MTVSPGKWRVLIIVENLPCPFDRRVWQEALALRAHGHTVSIVCPKGRGFDRGHEILEDVHIYRYGLPLEA